MLAETDDSLFLVSLAGLFQNVDSDDHTYTYANDGASEKESNTTSNSHSVLSPWNHIYVHDINDSTDDNNNNNESNVNDDILRWFLYICVSLYEHSGVQLDS